MNAKERNSDAMFSHRNVTRILKDFNKLLIKMCSNKVQTELKLSLMIIILTGSDLRRVSADSGGELESAKGLLGTNIIG